MLLFYCASSDKLSSLRKKGIKGPVVLLSKLEDAVSKMETSKNDDIILVIHALKLDRLSVGKKNKKVQVTNVPAAAILNLDPYLPPSSIIAAGGYVMRKGKNEPEVLMIYRRGVWDLPKGKLDEGESVEECALREVREEVGIKKLSNKGDLGFTVHGYPRKNKYKVKTTYWYHMETSEEKFTPQAEEDIEKVKWIPWSKAVSCIGYEIFRKHMHDIESKLMAEAGSLV